MTPSINNLNDFAKRIEAIDDPTNARFVRGFVSGIVVDCPLGVLKEIASCVLEIRRRELRDEGMMN